MSGLNPLTYSAPDTVEQIALKYNNSPVAEGTFKIINAAGKSSNKLDSSLETSTTNYQWHLDPATNKYILYSANNNGQIDILTGWAFIEYQGSFNYYYFDPKDGTMKVGFYNDSTTKKSYFFEYDKTSPKYGTMLINTSKTIDGITFTANEKGEITFNNLQ